MSPRAVLRAVLRSGVVLALGAAGLLDACDRPDRFIDPNVSCADGPCVCVNGFDSCDGDDDNGCETFLASDAQNCGACGIACGNGECSGGSCTCEAGFADCDGDPSTACETNTDSSATSCGACGHGCGGGGCVSGVCQPATIAGLEDAESIAVADGAIFIARCGDPAVGQAHTDGGDVDAIGGVTTGCAHLVATANDSVYWVGDDEIVAAASLDSPEGRMDLAPGTSPTRFLAAGAAHVYWWSDDAAAPALVRVPVNGGTQEMVPATPLGLAVDATGAYWSDAGGVHLWRFDAGTIVVDINPLQAGLLAVSGDTLFAVAQGGIQSLPTTPGGEVTPVVATPSAVAIAADEAHVYWAEKSDGTVRRVGRDGVGMTVLATGEAFGGAVPFALDDRAVYWVAAQKVRKVAK